MMGYATLYDFAAHEIVPTLGGFEDDFDVMAIAREVCSYDGREFAWRSEYCYGSGSPCGFDPAAVDRYNEVCFKHSR